MDFRNDKRTSNRKAALGVQVSESPYVGTQDARWSLINARNSIRRREESLLFSCGWKKNKATYDGTITWSHPDVLDGTWLRRETAVSVAMGDLEVE